MMIATYTAWMGTDVHYDVALRLLSARYDAPGLYFITDTYG